MTRYQPHIECKWYFLKSKKIFQVNTLRKKSPQFDQEEYLQYQQDTFDTERLKWRQQEMTTYPFHS